MSKIKAVMFERSRKLFNGAGYNVTRHRDVRRNLLADYSVGLVLDVGANVGQYGTRLREGGYSGKIVSFEPLSEAYGELQKLTEKDTLWECRHMALGDADGSAEIHVMSSNASSSLLPLGASHQQAYPDLHAVRNETIVIKRLDTLAPELMDSRTPVYLKMDVQGYERTVLEGAQDALKRVPAIECELSLAPLYDGQPLFLEMLNYLDALGFECVSIERGFCDDTTNRTLQVDGYFVRKA